MVVLVVCRGVDVIGGTKRGEWVRSIGSLELDEVGVIGAGWVRLGLMPEWLWLVVELSLWSRANEHLGCALWLKVAVWF